MDEAQLGKIALEAKQYDEAIELYTKAIAKQPNAVDYYIARSQASHRRSPPNRVQALADADKAVNLATTRQRREAIFESQQQRFICLYGLERRRSCCFKYGNRKSPKIKPTWLENQENMTIELLNARGVPKDQAVVDIQERSVSINFPLADSSSTYEYNVDPLFSAIDPSQSSYSVTPNKIFVVLKKVSPGYWKRLEGVDDGSTAPTPAPRIPQEVLTGRPSAPAYPTSSRKGPKDWDKVVKEATRKEPKEGEKGQNKEEYDDLDLEDGGDDVNFFFKKLFADADPDTRKAMMKSYQESNGTALSTNWAEVSKGKVETSPPDGMEAKKWN
ncbi:SGS-domain-containing protein [Pseudovirgaria hyperparasitica]|uniref:SGS-domain-containing protein n=1 Tax=Pseudovirgaria hyperparasitica TaxID=470096 RepID=A0A6A6VY74_9PEZI|nr:SGS-domain-containing protein [Pseudovirgaria hyperparasitica]KAF2754766.1 SGS-domain-containing protein [Pseudovirgaria hyperparasitica]